MDNQTQHLKIHFHALNQIASSLEQCWMEGYYFASHGENEPQNPYRAGSKEAQFYDEGWWSGFYGEEALFPDFVISMDERSNHQSSVNSFQQRFIPKSPIERALMGLGLVVGTGALLTTVMIDLAA